MIFKLKATHGEWKENACSKCTECAICCCYMFRRLELHNGFMKNICKPAIQYRAGHIWPTEIWREKIIRNEINCSNKPPVFMCAIAIYATLQAARVKTNGKKHSLIKWLGTGTQTANNNTHNWPCFLQFNHFVLYISLYVRRLMYSGYVETVE